MKADNVAIAGQMTQSGRPETGGGGSGGGIAPSYAAWVRSVIRRVKAERNLLISLFDSSVPEPLPLLQDLLREGFGGQVTSRYASAFAGGNPFVVGELARRYGVDEAQVLCTTGATGALALIYKALLKPGDRVLVENPAFDIFHSLARTQGIAVDRFERTGPRFTIDPETVAAAIRPETRLIVVSNLHNPSGMATSALEALARIAEERGVLLVVDEVYADYAAPDPLTGSASAPAVRLSPNAISISSLTKTYGLSTLRCGWIVAAAEVTARIRELAGEIEFGVSNLTHALGALVLERYETFDAYRDGIMRRARPIIESYHAHWRAEGLVEGELPAGACIAFPRLVGIADTHGFSEWLADRCGVIVAPGEYFGRAGHIRIGFARAPADVDYGLQALTDGLMRYRALR